MYISVFSRSLGAGSATTRKTRGLTRSVSARIVPPLPAVSRPSKTMTARWPLRFTHSWSLQSSVCSFRSSPSYSLFLSFMLAPHVFCGERSGAEEPHVRMRDHVGRHGLDERVQAPFALERLAETAAFQEIENARRDAADDEHATGGQDHEAE